MLKTDYADKTWLKRLPEQLFGRLYPRAVKVAPIRSQINLQRFVEREARPVSYELNPETDNAAS